MSLQYSYILYNCSSIFTRCHCSHFLSKKSGTVTIISNPSFIKKVIFSYKYSTISGVRVILILGYFFVFNNCFANQNALSKLLSPHFVILNKSFISFFPSKLTEILKSSLFLMYSKNSISFTFPFVVTSYIIEIFLFAEILSKSEIMFFIIFNSRSGSPP